ncbi:adenylate kinase [Halovivax cerinus]|uniref:Adenylate kinase n=1 Tax=Halovivax cerinus TaxID=1487865 RepID=A0ABD5NNR4_9EURY|nr:adenylate kinase [Halovivax cerinus]
MDHPRILIMGAPGAGKGTQSANITDAFDVEHVTTGDALRSNDDMDISDLGLEYDTPRAYMDRGELVPDEVVNAIVEKALADAAGFVLDGYPRNMDQASELEDMTELDVVLSLEVSEDELIDRLTGRRVCADCGANYHVDFDPPETDGVCDECGGDLIQRDDDTEETVTDRLRVYHENTEPVIEYYAEQGRLERIDGEQTADAVWDDIRETIERAA